MGCRNKLRLTTTRTTDSRQIDGFKIQYGLLKKLNRFKVG
jgi:hypothetical protein